MRRIMNAKATKRLTIVAASALPLSLAAEIMWSSGPADGYTGAPRGEHMSTLP